MNPAAPPTTERGATPAPPEWGSLCLVPAPLDFGIEGRQAADLQEQLPLGALRRAAQLRFWVVENAKSARAFLKRVDAVVPLALPLQQLQMSELPRPQKGASPGAAAGATSQGAWTELLHPAMQGHDLGLLSEAGLAAVADPGAKLVAQAHALGVRVHVLPGASALTLALAGSGLNGQSFAFVGYLPSAEPERSRRIAELEGLSGKQGQTQLFIETPYRNEALFEALLKQLRPQTQVFFAQALGTPQATWCSQKVALWRVSSLRPSNGQPCVFGILAA